MIETVWTTVRGYYAFYAKYFVDQWYHMTPIKYGMLLISVGLFGWVLMKTGQQRS